MRYLYTVLYIVFASALVACRADFTPREVCEYEVDGVWTYEYVSRLQRENEVLLSEYEQARDALSRIRGMHLQGAFRERERHAYADLTRMVIRDHGLFVEELAEVAGRSDDYLSERSTTSVLFNRVSVRLREIERDNRDLFRELAVILIARGRGDRITDEWVRESSRSGHFRSRVRRTYLSTCISEAESNPRQFRRRARCVMQADSAADIRDCE